MRGRSWKRPVGGSALRVVLVVRPPKKRVRAYAALAPKAVVLAYTRRRRRKLAAVPVAVTGSVGKTTTRGLLEAALATVGPTVANPVGPNRALALARTVARADSSTRFLVEEVGVSYAGPGTLDELLWALEPRVAVITAVLGDHLEMFGTLDQTALEKAKAVTALPPSGLAVLNADDERVRAMADLTSARVILVGWSTEAAVRIVEAGVDSEGRLNLRLEDGGREHSLSMQLVGAHWALVTALAFATATRLGADPESAIGALESVVPMRERGSVVRAANGARFLLDTAKATQATIEHSLAAVRGMPAARRIVVVGGLYDFAGGTPADHARIVTEQALAVADEVVLYGRTAEVAPAETLAHPRVRAFRASKELSDDLWSRLSAGDVVLLLGNYLSRVALRTTHDVTCWIDDCTRRSGCTICPLLGPRLE